MKICLLGSTGRTGVYVLHEALERGHEVRALVRNPTKVNLTSDQLTLIEGSPLDKEALKEAMQGCDVLLNTLNISRASEFPWSKLVSPPDLLSRTMANVIELAGETGLRHVVAMTAFGTHETRQLMPFWFRWIADSSKIGVTYRDHERQEDLLRASGLDWTIVRPVGLTNAEKDQEVLVFRPGGPKPAMTISRKAVARFMVAAAEKGDYIGAAVGISERR